MIYVDVRILHKRFPGKYDHIQSGRVPVTAEDLRASARPPRAIQGGPGLGDMVKGALSSIGITEERVSKAIGRPCGCGKRAEALNALGRKVGIG
jgi:hypothetical protein